MIVLSQSQNASPLFKADSNIYNLLTQKTSEKSLKTQVEILKSASVLMPVFENFKELMNLQNDQKDLYRFNSWSDNLKVTLKPNTSVLNIVYKDYNKNNVLIILNQISEIYKSYIKDERITGLKKGSDFINEQIQIYEKLYFDSIIKEKNFASENNLSYKRSNVKNENTRNELITYQSEEIIKKNLNEIIEIDRNVELIKVQILGIYV